MDKKMKPGESIDSKESDPLDPEEAFAPFRALEDALGKIIRVTTSRIRLRKNDPSSEQLVPIDGPTDETTLSILKESVSGIFAEESRDNAQSIGSPPAQDRICRWPILESALHETASNIAEAAPLAAYSTTKFTIRLRTFSHYVKQLGVNAIPEATSLIAGSRESIGIPREAASTARSSTTTATSGSFYSIPSCSSSFDGVVDPDSLRNAENVIAELERNGPAGLVHLSSLSAAIGKPIRVWSSGDKVNSRKVGRTRSGEPVDIEYHEPGPGDSMGHWTLRDNAEPRDDVEGQLNDCLFSVVAEQIGLLAPELRARTIARMRENVRSLAHRIEDIAKRERCERISLLVGGARYTGQGPADAKAVLDASQRGVCYPSGLQGHPRGHASHPGATGPIESVENYSRGGWKTGFLSRSDQDVVAHLVLKTPEANSAMIELNRGATNVALRLTPQQIGNGPLPTAAEFGDGAQLGPDSKIRMFVIVLRHHSGQQNNPEADVFVHTFYPAV